MSTGRGRFSQGHGKGRGNRGSSQFGRGNRPPNNNNNNNNNNSGPRIKQFAPLVAGKPQAATFQSVKDDIVLHIQGRLKNGQDIAACISDMQEHAIQEPTRTVSTKANADEKKMEQDGFDIKYQVELSKWSDRVEQCEEGMSKAYSIILDKYCTTAMKHCI